jgi:hypothetical protein
MMHRSLWMMGRTAAAARQRLQPGLSQMKKQKLLHYALKKAAQHSSRDTQSKGEALDAHLPRATND